MTCSQPVGADSIIDPRGDGHDPRRLTDLGATLTVVMSADGLDHYAAGMKDPEGNEFDIS